MNHSQGNAAPPAVTDDAFSSPLQSCEKRLPSEIYTPETLQAISMISFTSIGDDDDDFQSPRDCKKLLLLDIKNMDYPDEEKEELPGCAKRNSSLPMIRPERKKSGADPFAVLEQQQQRSTSDNRSIVEPPEEDSDSDSDWSEESGSLHEAYGDDDLERSERQKFNSSFPAMKPQRKKSGDLLALVQQQQPKEDEDSDSEESTCDDDDLDRSKRQKRNSSIPIMKPQRKRSGELLKTAVQKQQQSTSNNRDIIEENEDSDSDGSQTYDDDDLDLSKREKRNSSIPVMKPQRKKSGDINKEKVTIEPSSQENKGEDCDSDLEECSLPDGTYYDSDSEESLMHESESNDDLDLSKREKRNSSTPMMKPQRKKSGDLFPYFGKEQQLSTTSSHGDLPEQVTADPHQAQLPDLRSGQVLDQHPGQVLDQQEVDQPSDAVGDLEYEPMTHPPPPTAPRWSSPEMAGLLHKPMRKSSMGYCTTIPVRCNSTPSRRSFSRSERSFSRSERSQGKNKKNPLNIKRWLGTLGNRGKSSATTRTPK